MRIKEPQLAVLDLAEAFVQTNVAGAQTFDFAAQKHQSGLEGILDIHIASGLLVFGYQLAHNGKHSSGLLARRKAQ
jgi:hypothetical protein